MSHRERFAEVVERPDPEVPLDRAWALLTARAHPAVDPDELLARLDDLAAACRVPTLDGLVDHLFVDQGFAGNRAEYYDPANSYLDDVLDRHLGIPISLSVLTLEVGRRLGVPLAPIGFPGHFLLRDQVDQDLYLDPFRGGARLDRAACEQLFRGLHGDRAAFDPRWLAPVGHRAVLGRMLANLVAVFERADDDVALLWARDLQAMVAAAVGDHRASRRLRAGLN
jgi:regulator of sirC expression with transglutaminase-like and TPR domain